MYNNFHSIFETTGCLAFPAALKVIWLLMATDCVHNKDGTSVTYFAY